MLLTSTCLIIVPGIREWVSHVLWLRKTVSLGGDADTLGAITGAIAEAYYGGIPVGIIDEVRKRVHAELWNVIEEFGLMYASNAG